MCLDVLKCVHASCVEGARRRRAAGPLSCVLACLLFLSCIFFSPRPRRVYTHISSIFSGTSDWCGQRTLPLTLGHMLQVLLWATVIFVIVGGVVLLGYNLLPPGSFSRAWRGDMEAGGDDDEENKWTRAQYAAPNQGSNYGGAAPMRQV